MLDFIKIHYTFDTETLSFITNIMQLIYCYVSHVSHQYEHNYIIGELYQVLTYSHLLNIINNTGILCIHTNDGSLIGLSIISIPSDNNFSTIVF